MLSGFKMRRETLKWYLKKITSRKRMDEFKKMYGVNQKKIARADFHLENLSSEL